MPCRCNPEGGGGIQDWSRSRLPPSGWWVLSRPVFRGGGDNIQPTIWKVKFYLHVNTLRLATQNELNKDPFQVGVKLAGCTPAVISDKATLG